MLEVSFEPMMLKAIFQSTYEHTLKFYNVFMYSTVLRFIIIPPSSSHLRRLWGQKDKKFAFFYSCTLQCVYSVGSKCWGILDKYLLDGLGVVFFAENYQVCHMWQERKRGNYCRRIWHTAGFDSCERKGNLCNKKGHMWQEGNHGRDDLCERTGKEEMARVAFNVQYI